MRSFVIFATGAEQSGVCGYLIYSSFSINWA